MEIKTKKGVVAIGASATIITTAIALILYGGLLGAGSSLVKVEVPIGNYHPNSIFNVTISCTPTRPVKAWELQVNYNKNVIHAISVTEGTFFSPYQTFFNAGTIDNDLGKITKLYDLVVGIGNKSTAGTFISIKFQAINYGVSNITLTGVGLTNETMYIPREISNGTVRIYAPFDMNNDGVINMIDLLDVANHYGEIGTPYWIKEDVNGDGKVDILDLVIISVHWGIY